MILMLCSRMKKPRDKHKKIMDFFYGRKSRIQRFFPNLLKVQAGFGKDGEKGFGGSYQSYDADLPLQL